MCKLAILFLLTALIGGSFSLCIWPKTGGVLNVCKREGKADCIGVTSSSTCINLVGGPFVSGFTTGNYQCTIYSSTGCSGTTISVDRSGWSRFPITPKSLKCPCV
ncbi:hypothetical protein PVAND_010735 [Polypedilum vanderplanki]|uniref:Alpha-amylase C-terminal prokaryotic domain-containing protein n=1 Tax=Polypedilum vanderplanki TaxID=319348 RepID=A0A9J6CGW2_POLVA|nr:hypothetical protein PVAND_010735 [Polypedilum vanderplanki]